jgi:hypothetical protein
MKMVPSLHSIERSLPSYIITLYIHSIMGLLFIQTPPLSLNPVLSTVLLLCSLCWFFNVLFVIFVVLYLLRPVHSLALILNFVTRYLSVLSSSSFDMLQFNEWHPTISTATTSITAPNQRMLVSMKLSCQNNSVVKVAFSLLLLYLFTHSSFLSIFVLPRN